MEITFDCDSIQMHQNNSNMFLKFLKEVFLIIEAHISLGLDVHAPPYLLGFLQIKFIVLI